TYNGISCTYCDSVTTGNTIPTCSISFFRDTNNTNAFMFIDSSGAFIGVQWDFGDGTYGQGSFVTHTYAAAGNYTVCVHETSGGLVLCTSCITVTAGANSPTCNAYYVASSLGLTTYFINLSNVDPASATYLWSFGDGTSSTTRF